MRSTKTGTGERFIITFYFISEANSVLNSIELNVFKSSTRTHGTIIIIGSGIFTLN